MLNFEGGEVENLLPSVVTKSGGNSMGHMGGLHGLAGGLGDLVLNISAGHLGDGVAVLHLHGDQLHLGVVHAVLGGHLTAGVLHSGGHRVGNSVGNRGNSSNGGNTSSIGETSKVLGISLSLSFTLDNGGGRGSDNSRAITDGVSDLLADLLVLNLLSVYSLLGADILGRGGADLGGEDLLLSHTVGGRKSSNGSGIGGSEELGVSLSLRLGGSCSKGKQARDGKNLHLV